MMLRRVGEIIYLLNLLDIIPNMRVMISLPCLLPFVRYAASASQMDEETRCRLLSKAGEDGSCAASMVMVSRICQGRY